MSALETTHKNQPGQWHLKANDKNSPTEYSTEPACRQLECVCVWVCRACMWPSIMISLDETEHGN